MFEHPYYPIVYIRGYAMTQKAVESTVADPYMGFNLGSTKIRQLQSGDTVRHIFESPLVRLIKDEGYSDIYLDGAELPASETPSPRSLWIYRYYEPVSKSLGNGERPEIEDYAEGLKRLIDSMQDQYCGRKAALRKKFRVYLVAHSMGGLVARCFLQSVSPKDPRVDKLFTFATPHGGIDLRAIGNVPDFLRFNNSENFSEKRMRKYLSIGRRTTPVQSLNGKFPEERTFSLIGTNHRDYSLARMAVGPMSDGLVQIKNASIEGGPRAFVHRSHSGDYGIVNSEEGYQNLRRFLFGNVRANVYLDIKDIHLPAAVQQKKDDGKKVEAAYHIEVVGRVRGVRWDLHRRLADEGSAILGNLDDLVTPETRIQLASSFLTNRARVNKRRQGLGFSIDLGVRVPEYIVGGNWFNRDHYEGGYLFREKINLEASHSEGEGWSLKYGFDSSTPNRATRLAERVDGPNGTHKFLVPIEQNTKPGIKAVMEIETSRWNLAPR